MNKAIYNIYSDLFSTRSRDFTRCRKIAHEAEMNVYYQPLIKEHFNQRCENMYHDGFEKQHKRLVENVRDLGSESTNSVIAKKIAKADTPEKLYMLFKNIESVCRKSPFAQKIHELFMLMFSPKTYSPDSRTIEEKLKAAGVRHLRLGSNDKDANHLLSAIEIAKKHNDRLPDKVFFSELLDTNRLSEGFVYYPDNNVMVLASPRLRAVYQDYVERLKNELEKSPVYRGFSNYLKNVTQQYLFCSRFSVDSPIRIPMHELGHINQPKNLPTLKFSDLDCDDKMTAINLTSYLTSDDLLPEIFSELYAKMRIKGKKALTAEERTLLQRIIDSGESR